MSYGEEAALPKSPPRAQGGSLLRVHIKVTKGANPEMIVRLGLLLLGGEMWAEMFLPQATRCIYREGRVVAIPAFALNSLAQVLMLGQLQQHRAERRLHSSLKKGGRSSRRKLVLGNALVSVVH